MSWINQVERFFAKLTDKRPHRSVHASRPTSRRVIKNYIDTVNAPRPLWRWQSAARRRSDARINFWIA